MVHPPHAIAAGLGRLGRHGLVITDRFGPSVRWGAVTTHMPLQVDAPNPEDV
ncbi:MAG: iron-sulfur cluster-binding protein, partial [Thermoplasmata archaeon]|nr:iron-sulfur cluster-binding protein [Thermoplasmata archaeon]NIS10681.1 iron-sulfur cluster-binding protein [Thermoplasmata archaeon]NIT75633.1 iron-sulfur cluster-binding protein [Thermoplasmata archaeon]NIU47785.1 iron-sulfur cluster-binding protein [Thermoplasmata archaeon]NIV77435.1 iron-sulfur cluster-binding protein [Thermoplasmata archaeon]